MPANYVLLGKVNLAASAASVTFSNIPQTGYTDLLVKTSIRNSVDGDGMTLVFNGVGSAYSTKQLYGTGSAAGSNTPSQTNFITLGYTTTVTANTFGNMEFYVPNYTSANYKSVSVDSVQEGNQTQAYSALVAGLWSNNAAIFSVTVGSQSGTFNANSTFYLYGLAAVGATPVIAPFASGGDVVTNDGTYWYHAFLSSGTFTPNKALTASCLVVAGGGGSGRIVTGGAGAGGLISTSASFTSGTSQTITVGAGGTGAATGSYGAGTNGSDSQIGSLTLVKGGGTTQFLTAGSTGGSGGGGSSSTGTGGGAGTSGQGYAGGSGAAAGGAGGGGGAGAVGTNATTTKGGDGGIGYYDSFTDAIGAATSLGQLSGGHYYFAGGGGGSATGAGFTSANRGAGGLGGGGYGGYTNSSASSDTAGLAGTANTGGGGGGAPNDYTGANSNTYGTNGGSGIVIIRYSMV